MFRSCTRLASFVVLIATVGTLALGQKQDGGGRPAPRPISGDGRGLANFGDRGLTTFGDRPLASVGNRDLESFGDRPLASMGGLTVPGPSDPKASARKPQDSRNVSGTAPPRRLFDHFEPATTRAVARRSIVSIRGVVVGDAAQAPTPVVLPAIAPPVLTLDHRPALATLERSLRDEARRAELRGDVDVARSLLAGTQR